MTEYAWPAVLRPSRLSFYLQHNTLRFVSPVTRATQVLRREGARWVAEASFEPLGRVQAGVMDGLLAALAGSANTVRIWDWRREYRTGDPRSQGDVPIRSSSSRCVGPGLRPGTRSFGGVLPAAAIDVFPLMRSAHQHGSGHHRGQGDPALAQTQDH